MPFFGRATNTNYGGFQDIGDGITDKYSKPQDREHLLGVDMPMLAETSMGDQYKAFIIGKDAPNGDLKPPTSIKVSLVL